MNQAMTPLDFAVHAMRVNGGAPCDIAAAESAEGELRALREDRASIDAMAILLGRARDERDSARTQLAEKDAALQAAIQQGVIDRDEQGRLRDDLRAMTEAKDNAVSEATRHFETVLSLQAQVQTLAEALKKTKACAIIPDYGMDVIRAALAAWEGEK